MTKKPEVLGRCAKCGDSLIEAPQVGRLCVSCAAEDEGPSKPHSMRATRYVYHINGHAKLHAHAGPHHAGRPEAGPIVPFEVVLRRPFAIDSDGAMDEVRQEVRAHIVAELEKQGSPYIVGDVMVRGVSKLHRILVEADDPDGPAARIMS